ncbi:EKC/KEOPS complex subunit GON7 [Madurella fahalii]|uniref:EKC/KEOPS complex subunit GON7 n=1 Tax=Madurella fahalii TaxID=1157608 RepID=A0ABQ0G6L4_9PEZI
MATQTPLSATYTSTTNPPFAISLPLTTPPVSTTVESKTKYLAALRQSTISLQEQVNRELTARMEEDKVRDASATTAAGGNLVDDKKEEENYGEEVQEEED